jgi:predicted RNA-binding Zn-ribbon protein involved in translation (DUF1610 family)
MVSVARNGMLFHHNVYCEIAPVLICQQCGHSSDPVQTRGARHTCPDCGAALAVRAEENRPDDHWTSVARVSNLAEAGFLADDLAAAQIDARLDQSDEFSAVNGRWSTFYLIQVPSEQAHDAATRIRRHLADEESYAERKTDLFMASDYDERLDPAMWRPLALVVLAGVASFVLGQRFAVPEGNRRAPRDSLSAAVDAIGQPLMTEPAPGKPRYRLSFDWRREAWYLDADADGDGRFESRRRFHAIETGR